MSSLLSSSTSGARRLRHLLDDARGRLLRPGPRRQVTANSAWLLFDRLVRTTLSLLVGAWVARHLGPAEFGTLAYVVAYVMLFLPLATLSADAIVVRSISQSPHSAGQLLGSALLIRAGLGMACWLASWLGLAVFNEGDARLLVLAGFVGASLIFQSADVIDLWFQSQSQNHRTVVAKFVAYGVSSGAKVALILGGADLEWFAAAAALETAITAAALAVAYRRLPTGQRWQVDRETCRSLVAEAWPFMLSGAAVMVYMRIDQIMIKEMLGSHDLGIYAVVVPISQFWQVLPLALCTSLAPVIARQRIADEAVYRRSIVLIFRAFFYGAVAAAALTYCISDWLVRALFGAAYAQAAPILDVHVISNVFLFLGVAHGLWLVNERRFTVRLYGTLAAGAATIALNFVLLPRIGLLGACIAAIVAQAIAAVLINLVFDRQSFRLQVEAIIFRKV